MSFKSDHVYIIKMHSVERLNLLYEILEIVIIINQVPSPVIDELVRRL